MRITKNIGIALLLAAMLVSCGRQTHTITDVTAPHTIVLQKKPSQKFIHSIEIHGSGSVEGTARLVLLLNGEPYQEARLSGTIDFTWKRDWYADQAELLFEPGTATAGTVSLRYRFRD